jgi:hypothetical protein
MALVGFEKTSEELGNNNKKNIYFLEIPIHFILDLDLRALSLSLWYSCSKQYPNLAELFPTFY